MLMLLGVMLLCHPSIAHNYCRFLLFTTRSKRLVGGTHDTLRLAGDMGDIEDCEVSISRFIDDDTMVKLSAAAEAVFSKSSHGRLMKPIQVVYSTHNTASVVQVCSCRTTDLWS